MYIYIIKKKIVNIFGPQSKTFISLLLYLELQIKLMLVIFSRMFELPDQYELVNMAVKN